jgi:hypothetical protein
MPQHNEAFLARHADKGEWKFNEEELKATLPEPEANLVKNVLKEKGLLDQSLPLKLDGLKRCINAAGNIYDRLPERAILVSVDSNKPRAELSQYVITARIAQLESKHKNSDKEKRVDMLHVDDKEFAKLMQDEGTDTWDTFAAMMPAEGISESAAIAREVNAVDRPGVTVPGEESLEQAAARYKKVLSELRSRITSENIPVVIMGIGHSGPLSVIAHREKGGDITEADIPQFAEMFVFDTNNRLVKREKTEI